MTTDIEISVTVNGASYVRRVEARTSLADFLREELGLTGTHLGCEQGVCGACTVLVDGATARSCLMLAAQVHGARVETVESLSDGAGLHPIQQAFRDRHGLQCGFCTPGFLLSAWELLQARTGIDASEAREALSGNVCRCTGYEGIVEAVQQADQTWERATSIEGAS